MLKFEMQCSEVFFMFASHDENQRRRFDFKHHFAWMRFNQMCISVTGVKLWNSQRDNLKGCNNIFRLKKCVESVEMLWTWNLIRCVVLFSVPSSCDLSYFLKDIRSRVDGCEIVLKFWVQNRSSQKQEFNSSSCSFPDKYGVSFKWLKSVCY